MSGPEVHTDAAGKRFAGHVEAPAPRKGGASRVDLLKASEVADIFGVNPREPLRWAKAGQLPAIRVNRKTVRFLREDVEALIRRSRQQQGLPEHVEDPDILSQVASKVATSP